MIFVVRVGKKVKKSKEIMIFCIVFFLSKSLIKSKYFWQSSSPKVPLNISKRTKKLSLFHKPREFFFYQNKLPENP